MNGGHGEWFVQHFGENGLPQGETVSLTPGEAVAVLTAPVIAGNRALQYAGAADDHVIALDLLPDARQALSLPRQVLSHALAPLYGREPDAKPQQ